MDVLPPPVSS